MPDTFATALHAWQGFYQVTGESAATLTGLMFIAVTVGGRVLTAATEGVARLFIVPTLGYFTTVLVLSALMCVPTQTQPWLAAQLCFLGLAGLSRLGSLLVRMRRLHRRLPLGRLQWVSHMALPTAGYLCLLAAALGLWRHWPGALNALSLCVLLLIITGVINAWGVTLRSILVTPEEIIAMETEKDSL